MSKENCRHYKAIPSVRNKSTLASLRLSDVVKSLAQSSFLCREQTVQGTLSASDTGMDTKHRCNISSSNVTSSSSDETSLSDGASLMNSDNNDKVKFNMYKTVINSDTSEMRKSEDYRTTSNTNIGLKIKDNSDINDTNNTKTSRLIVNLKPPHTNPIRSAGYSDAEEPSRSSHTPRNETYCATASKPTDMLSSLRSINTLREIAKSRPIVGSCNAIECSESYSNAETERQKTATDNCESETARYLSEITNAMEEMRKKITDLERREIEYVRGCDRSGSTERPNEPKELSDTARKPETGPNLTIANQLQDIPVRRTASDNKDFANVGIKLFKRNDVCDIIRTRSLENIPIRTINKCGIDGDYLTVKTPKQQQYLHGYDSVAKKIDKKIWGIDTSDLGYLDPLRQQKWKDMTKAKVIVSNSEIIELKQNLASATMENEIIHAKIENASKEFEERLYQYSLKAKTSEERINCLQAENNELRRYMTNEKNISRGLAENAENLLQKLNTVENDNSRLKENVSETVTMLEDTVKVSSDIHDLRMEVDVLTCQLDAVTQNEEKLRQENFNLKTTKDKLSNVIRELKNELDECRLTNGKLLTEIKRVRTQEFTFRKTASVLSRAVEMDTKTSRGRQNRDIHRKDGADMYDVEGHFKHDYIQSPYLRIAADSSNALYPHRRLKSLIYDQCMKISSSKQVVNTSREKDPYALYDNVVVNPKPSWNKRSTEFALKHRLDENGIDKTNRTWQRCSEKNLRFDETRNQMYSPTGSDDTDLLVEFHNPVGNDLLCGTHWRQLGR